MCHRRKLYSIGLFAAGLGLIISCLFPSWLFRLLIGVVLVILSLLICRQ